MMVFLWLGFSIRNG